MADEVPAPHIDLLQKLIDELLSEEVNQFLRDPMIVEFGIACEFLADIIKKAPPQAKPALLAALIVVIQGCGVAANSLVSSFPTVIHPLDYVAGKVVEVPEPVSLTGKFITMQGALLTEYVTKEVYG